MTKKGKLVPSWIAKASARKATFNKRKKGLIKKVSELSILCDVPAFLIIFGDDVDQPEIWSSTPDPVPLLLDFIGLPETERSKKMLDQEAFIKSQVKKLEDQLRKLELENHELETKLLMHKALRGDENLKDISAETAKKLSPMIETRIAQVEERISTMKTEMFLNDSPDEDSNLPSFFGGDTDDHPNV